MAYISQEDLTESSFITALKNNLASTEHICSLAFAQMPDPKLSSWVVGPAQTSCHAACEAYDLGCSVQEMQSITDSTSFVNAIGSAFPSYVASCVYFTGDPFPVSNAIIGCPVDVRGWLSRQCMVVNGIIHGLYLQDQPSMGGGMCFSNGTESECAEVSWTNRVW